MLSLLRSRTTGTILLAGLITLAAVSMPGAAQAQTFQALDQASLATGTNTQDFKFTQARDGNLYVTANEGGSVNGNCLYGCGQILAITTLGTVITQIHAFDYVAEGAYPRGGLTLGTDGNLYGVLSANGASGFGSIFKITTAGAVTILHSFTDTGDGSSPSFPPIQATDGNFYGTTNSAGGSGNGVLYKLTPNGTFTVLHTFDRTVEGDGGGALFQASDGKLYTVAAEGSLSWGTILRFTTTGTVTVLHNFLLDQSEGTNPYSPLVQTADGNLYGVCYSGGAQNAGTIWKISPGGTFKVVYSVNGTTDGQNLGNALSLGTDGKLYGTTQYQGVNGGGTIFQFNSDVYTVLYSFSGANTSTSGEYPNTILTQDTNGLFHGITAYGGTAAYGTFYDLNNGLAAFASLVSTSGKEGARIGIVGQGFTAATTVKFAGVSATSITHTNSSFTIATVPAAALTGSVTVTTGATTLTSKTSFRVTPTITGFTPPNGPVGTSVTLTGTGLTQATKVTFNGTSATFTVNSDIQITATVPTGATTGKIAVATKGGSASTTTSFTVN